jgi:hypothetical protein
MAITVEAVHRKVQYTSTGSAGPYAFSFKVLAATDIKVSVDATLKTVTTHYTTAYNSDGTGSVTFTSGNEPASDTLVTIESDQAIARTTDYSTGGDFTAASINDALDRLTINDQQIETELSRNIQLASTTKRTTSGTGTSGPLFWPYDATVSNNANKVVSYDSNGTALELGPSASQITSASANATAAANSATAAASSATAAASSASSASSSATTAAAASAGIYWKQPCVVASTGNLTLSGNQTIDGVSVSAGSRVLVKDQSSASENGVYVTASGAWSRAVPLNEFDEFIGAVVAISEGSTNADTSWICTVDAGGSLGSTNITWAAFGTGDLKSSNNLSDVASAATAFGNLKQAASTSATGVVELATNAETATGSDSTRAVTPAAAASAYVAQGTHTIWVPAAAMRPTVSNGCAAITDVETTAGRPDLQVLDFDKDSDEHAQFQIAMPKSWNEGTITFKCYWIGLAATTGVAFGLQGVAVGDNEEADQAYGTAVVVTDDSQGDATEVLVTATSGAVTIANSPAAEDLCFFRIFRDVSDSNDDMAGDARLLGVKIFYTVNAKDDS